jgi:low affinity Fe/Cu permease
MTHPLSAVVVGVLVLVSWIVIIASDFDEDLQLAFGTVCGGVTVTIVFSLLHTQRREQVALQLKLNEIIRAMPQADDHLIGVEASSDDELIEIGRSHVGHHSAIRDNDANGDPR